MSWCALGAWSPTSNSLLMLQTVSKLLLLGIYVVLRSIVVGVVGALERVRVHELEERPATLALSGLLKDRATKLIHF